MVLPHADGEGGAPFGSERWQKHTPLRMGLEFTLRPRGRPRAEAKKQNVPFSHIAGQNDDLVKVAPLLGMVEGWSAFLAEETATEHVELLRLHERTGRPR